MRLLRLFISLLVLAVPTLILQDCVGRDTKDDAFTRELREAQRQMVIAGHTRPHIQPEVKR